MALRTPFVPLLDMNSGVPISRTTSAVDTQSTPYLLDQFIRFYSIY